MSGASSIEWTDATWNPVRGCSRVSEGCRNCYAERQSARFSGPGQYAEGFTKRTASGPRWTGEVALVPHLLDWPLRKKKPLRIFVNSMSDLFHEGLKDEAIGAVFVAMAAAPQHTFQVLTKRPERMRRWLEWAAGAYGMQDSVGAWPLPNVWLGTSVEDQATADERVPHLLATPAAKRFVSYEPALGPVEFDRIGAKCQWEHMSRSAVRNEWPNIWSLRRSAVRPEQEPGLDWIIVGGESGPGARPFDVAWARSTVEQCKAAGVACFVKQIGRRVHGSPEGFLVDRYIFSDHEWQPPIIGWNRPRFERENAAEILGFKPFHPKGGNWNEWPEDLRVREFPT